MESEHEDVLSKPKHDEDGNKQGSLEGENGDVEHKRIHSEETGSVIIHSETHSRSLSSSSSSSSSSSYLSPPKDLPEDVKELSNEPEISSPPVQVMDRENNGNYDPNRIPSSVFERSKSNIPAEWSCTSNESLFSIHLGRNSFTGDLMKSGELYKSGELLAYSPALPMPPPPGSESKPVEKPKVVDSDKKEEVVLVEDTHTTSSEEEEEKRESHEKEQHPAVSWKTPTTSYRSNRSSNSAHSFSFPMYTLHP